MGHAKSQYICFGSRKVATWVAQNRNIAQNESRKVVTYGRSTPDSLNQFPYIAQQTLRRVYSPKNIANGLKIVFK